jgi:hypothetical protein
MLQILAHSVRMIRLYITDREKCAYLVQTTMRDISTELPNSARNVHKIDLIMIVNKIFVDPTSRLNIKSTTLQLPSNDKIFKNNIT